MCFLDFVGGNSFLPVNKKAARILGPTTAMYLASLLDVLSAVKKKKKYDAATGVFKLDRKFVESETGLTVMQQQNCDSVLEAAGIIKLHGKDTLVVYTNIYYNVLHSDDEEFLNSLTRTIQSAQIDFKDKLNSKKDAILASFRNYYLAKYSPAVTSALNELCGVLQERGKLNKLMITKFLSDVDEYRAASAPTDSQLVDLITTCAVNTWSDFTWAANRRKDYSKKSPSSIPLAPQRVAVAVDLDKSF